MMAYTKPQQRKKEGSEMLKGEREREREREIRPSLLILDLKDDRL